MAMSRFLRLAHLKESAKLCITRSYRHSISRYVECLKTLPETEVTELPNGLKVATEHTGAPVSNVGLWIDAGSRYESKSSNGAANFFEHLVFKGSKNRSGPDVERAIMNMGAELHASTGREETVFFAKCLPQDVPGAVDILSDAIQNPKIDDSTVEDQKKDILAELEAIETDLKQVAFDYLHLTAYQGTPLENTVYGPSENIKNMTKDDVTSYVQNNFCPSRMVLVGTGSVKHGDMVKLAEKHFGSMSPASSDAVLKPCRFTGSEVRARDDWKPFAHAAIAVDTCGYTSPDIYALMLGKAYIGSWDRFCTTSDGSANQLVQHIHLGKGCHSFEGFHVLYRDTGLWGCFFVMDALSLDDFVYNLQGELMKLCVSVTDADLARMKAKVRNELSFCLEDGSQSFADVGRQVHAFGSRIPLAEVVEKIEAVTLNHLRDTCGKYIYDRCPAVAAVGPVEAFPDYNRVRSGMFWLRY